MVRIVFILLFIPFDLLAQAFTPNPDWRFENFNNQNHFISAGIGDIAIDKNNYVWTSSTGVQRFDGNKTLDFNSFDRSNGGLKSNATDVIADHTGRLWVSSAGLCYYDDASGKFIYVQPDRTRKINGIDFMILKENWMWFICDYGLAKLNLQSLKISYTSLTRLGNPLGNFFVNDSTLLVSSREKVYFYNTRNDTYTSRAFVYNHSLLKIFAVDTTAGTTFLGTNSGLFTLNKLQQISPVPNGTNDIVVDLLFMPQDSEKKYLFIATEGNGIQVYNTVKKRIEFTYKHDDNNPYSISNNIISRLQPDNLGRLWMATGLGISMLDLDNQLWKMRFLEKSNANKIAIDKYDSTKAWMSSYTKGMIRMNWKTKQVEKEFFIKPEMRDIIDFVQLSKNKLLLAAPRKILEWDMTTGALNIQKLPLPDSVGLLNNITSLIMAGGNTCYITTTLGLFRYDLVAHRVYPVAVYDRSSSASDPFQYILLNGFYDNGTVWMASRNGLFSYNTKTNTTTIYRGKGESSDYYFFDISAAPGGCIVCADETGINVFNRLTKSFTVINSIANLYKPLCVNVLTENRKVWIATEAGIYNYDLDTHRSERAARENKLMQQSAGSYFAVIGNQIVRPYSNGYVYFNPNQKKDLTPSDPIIESVHVNNRPFLKYNSHDSKVEKTVFSHSENSINIDFTAFLYSNPTYINFRYRLVGAGALWQYAEDQRSANYAQLAPGDYTFCVQSGTRKGLWSKKPATFSFVILPPYWETWWFRTLAILLIAYSLYQLYRYRIKNILAIERIRERIASDFHDDIGAALSSISIFSEVADTQLEERMPHEQTREIVAHISTQSRAMLDAMDDIIWAVNPQNDHFKDLAVRMREFAIPLLEARNIQFDINIQPDVVNSRINMEARKNIFLIFKECINNILKHSGCAAIKISAIRSNGQLEIIVSDNGIGFDLAAENTRNGLKNMQKRAREINGVVHVSSKPGEGTVTRLVLNTV